MLIKRLIILLFVLKHKFAKFVQIYYKYAFILDCIGHRGSADISPSCRFTVPVRGLGCGKVIIGENVLLGYPQSHRLGTGEIMLQARTPNAIIKIGERCVLNNNFCAVACNSIILGKHVLVGTCVTILDSDFHEISPEKRLQGGSVGKRAPVEIGDNVWIGNNVTILKGVKIGAGSVIAPGAIVTKEIPAQTLAGGIPAKPIKNI